MIFHQLYCSCLFFLTISITSVICIHHDAVSKFLRAQCEFPPTVCMGLALKDAKTWDQIQKEENVTTTTSLLVRPILDESANHSNPDVYGRKCIKEGDCDIGLVVQPGNQFLTFRLFGSAEKLGRVRLLMEYNPFQLNGKLQFDCKPVENVESRAKRSNIQDLTSELSSEMKSKFSKYRMRPMVLSNGILNISFVANERELPLHLNPGVIPVRTEHPDQLVRPIDCVWKVDSRTMMHGFTQFPSTRLYIPFYGRRYVLRLAALSRQNQTILYGPAYLVDLRTLKNALYNGMYKIFLAVNLTLFVFLAILMAVFFLHSILFLQRMKVKLNQRVK